MRTVSEISMLKTVSGNNIWEVIKKIEENARITVKDNKFEVLSLNSYNCSYATRDLENPSRRLYCMHIEYNLLVEPGDLSREDVTVELFGKKLDWDLTDCFEIEDVKENKEIQ